MPAKAVLILFLVINPLVLAVNLDATSEPEGDVLAEVAAGCGAARDAEQSPLSSGEVAQPGFPLGLPPGFDVTPLGALPAQVMPPGLDAELGIGRLSVAAQSGGNHRVAAGPLLFVIEKGMLEIVVNGVSSYHYADSSLLIQRGEIYSIINPGAEPASVLVAAVEPPEGLISAYGDQSVWQVLPRDQEVILRERIADAELEHLSQEETLVFLGCLTWQDPHVELASGRGYPGPVAVLVLQGRLHVTTATVERLHRGDCTIVPRYTSFRITAGDKPAVALVMGALPVSALSAVATPETVPEDTAMHGSVADCAGWQAEGETGS